VFGGSTAETDIVVLVMVPFSEMVGFAEAAHLTDDLALQVMANSV
jgi:hypothetical protein